MFRRTISGSISNELILDIARLAPTFLVPGLTGFVSAPILFGILGAHGYGVYALALAIANGVPQLTASWVGSTILRFGHLGGSSPRSLIGSLVGSGFVGAFAASLVLSEESPAVWLEIGALTTAIAAYVLRSDQLQSRMRFAAVSSLATYRAVAGSTLAVILGALSDSPGGAIVGLAVGFAVVTVVTSPLSPETVGRSGAPAPGPSRPRGFGFASTGVALGLYLLSSGDRFVLDALRPLEEVGIYAITYTMTELVMRLIPSVLLVVMRPRVFRLWDSAEGGKASALVGDAIALLLWALACTQILWFLFIHLGGIAAVRLNIAGPVSIGITSLSVAFAVSLLHTARMSQVRLAATTIACAVIAIVADVVVTPGLGAVGAALVTAVAYSTLMIAHLVGSGLKLVRRDKLLVAVAFASIVANGLVPLAGVSALVLGGGAICLTALAPIALRIARSLTLDPTSIAP